MPFVSLFSPYLLRHALSHVGAQERRPLLLHLFYMLSSTSIRDRVALELQHFSCYIFWEGVMFYFYFFTYWVVHRMIMLTFLA
jgi:hypothetical protein